MNDKNKLKVFLNNYGKYLVGIAIVLIIIYIANQYFYYKEIKDYKKETIGVIEDFKYTYF